MACRCGRLWRWRDAKINPSKLACFLFPKEGGRVACCDLRWMQGLIAAVALGDGETQCAKVRSDNVSGRSTKRCAAFREHKPTDQADPSPSGVRVGRERKLPSPTHSPFAEPSTDRRMRFSPRWEQ